MKNTEYEAIHIGSNATLGGYETEHKVLTGPLVSIVTPAYNNEKFSEKYFESISNQTYKNIEVIFVDNNSSDGTVESARKLMKNGKILVSKINTGVAGGSNLGVLEASGKYVLLLNSDTWLDSRCVETLVRVAEGGGAPVLAPRQVAYDGSYFISCGIATDIFGYPVRTYTADGSKKLRRIFYADGAGIFVSRGVYLRVGSLDEESFLYHEDVDFSWKCHLVGLNVEPVFGAVVYHRVSAAVGSGGFPQNGKVYYTGYNRRYLAERNIIRNILKNYSWWNVVWILPYFILVNVFEIIGLTLTGQFTAVYKTYLKAYWWNVTNFNSTWKRRKAIQSIRTIGDGQILKIMYLTPSKLRGFFEIGIPRIN